MEKYYKVSKFAALFKESEHNQKSRLIKAVFLSILYVNRFLILLSKKMKIILYFHINVKIPIIIL